MKVEMPDWSHFNGLFSRGHATLHLAVLVRWSVGPKYFWIASGLWIIAPTQPSATGLPSIRPSFFFLTRMNGAYTLWNLHSCVSRCRQWWGEMWRSREENTWKSGVEIKDILGKLPMNWSINVKQSAFATKAAKKCVICSLSVDLKNCWGGR